MKRYQIAAARAQVAAAALLGQEIEPRVRRIAEMQLSEGSSSSPSREASSSSPSREALQPAQEAPQEDTSRREAHSARVADVARRMARDGSIVERIRRDRLDVLDEAVKARIVTAVELYNAAAQHSNEEFLEFLKPRLDDYFIMVVSDKEPEQPARKDRDLHPGRTAL